ncbi:MAG: HAD family hydrolase [Elusimicrobiota bacterium]|jgi:phosphoserine phosphatase
MTALLFAALLAPTLAAAQPKLDPLTPRRNLDEKTLVAPLAPRMARMTFHPSFEFFENIGKPWPQGKALGALWVHELDDFVAVGGLAVEPTGAVLEVETGYDSYRHLVRRLTPEGVPASSFTVLGYFRSILAGDLGGKPALVAQDMYHVQVLDMDGAPRWKETRTLESAVLCDLDGDGRGELVGAPARYKNEVAALSAEGRTLWSVSLPADRVLGVAAARLGGREGTLVAAFTARRGRATVHILDGQGRPVLDYPDDSSPETGVFGRYPDGTPFLATVGSRWQAGHDRLRVSQLSVSGRTRRLSAEAVLGPTHAVSLALVDFDGDHSPEIALGTDNGWVMVYDLKGRHLSQRHFFGSIPHLAAGLSDAEGRQRLLVAVAGASSRVYGVGLKDGLFTAVAAAPVASSTSASAEPLPPAWSKETDAALESFLEKGPEGPVVFEAEGTLWSGDAGDAFLRWLAAEGKLPGGKEALARYDALLRRARSERRAFGASLLAGMKEEEVRNLAGRFFTQNFYGRFYRPVSDLVARIRASGRPVWVASDSLRWVVEAGIELLDIEPERVLAVAPLVQDGVLTSKLGKPLPVGKGKASAVRKALGRKPALVVGGTEDGDGLLRSSSGAALLITHGKAGPKLQKIAEKRDWLVQDFPSLPPWRP